MNQTSPKIRIAVTGPESTGKTTLALQLADWYDGIYIPEFAREYVGNLPGHYTFDDVEVIARKQVEQYQATGAGQDKWYFFDTWLIITKVWFRWVYGKEPGWLDGEIRNCPIDLFLVCRPDLPWVADPVRENGGENRVRLYEMYLDELKHYGFTFVEIGGSGGERFLNAKAAVQQLLKKIS